MYINMPPAIGYCLKEKKKFPMKNVVAVRTKNNRYMLKGVCAQGHKINVFVKKSDYERYM